ncbi:MAG: SulP family inorganic anion transporter [Actinomycetota bacterium]|nr:SulP family inorganic anion transporter [Actinomycetota bacterium]
MTAPPSVLDRIPVVRMVRSYRRDYVRYDVVAGLVLATMLIPQGMAYAELTGLPAVTGIYTTIAALIAYALLGPNRQLVLGPDSSLAPVIAVVILPLAAGDAATAVILASALSIIAGLVCIAAGYLRLGVITELLSKPIRIGYLNGIAVIVLVSQLPKALGFSVDAGSSVETFLAVLGGVFDGETVGAALALSAGSVLTIVGLRRISRTIPGVVVAAVGSIVAVALFDLIDRGVQVVGDIPSGLPPLTIPTFDASLLPTLIGGAVAVALVSFADTGALSTATALKSGTRVDPNSEIKALGSANLLSGMFQGFPTSASSSRTAVAMAVGSKTQMTGLIAAAGVILIILLAPGIIAEMPSPTLAAIVITASFTLFDWGGTMWLLKIRRSEFLMSLGAFLGVVLVGILEGIVIAILLSIGNFVRKAWWPHSTELGKVEGVPGYHDIERHPSAKVIPGLLMLRFDAPLFFANAPTFGRRLQERLRSADRDIDTVLVVGNAITDIDTTGAEILGDVLHDLDKRGIAFAFAGLKGPVKDRLKTYGLYERIGDENFHANTISAVKKRKRDLKKHDEDPAT